jgi:hypothetical protein
MQMALEAVATNSVTLTWTASNGLDIAGYRVYWGTASQNYSNLRDVGPVTTATISDLSEGLTYYFAATAYDIAGLESPLSSEISYTVPLAPPAPLNLQLTLSGAGQPLLTGLGLPGSSYDVMATSYFTNWTVLGNVSAGLDGTIQFVDPGPRTNKMRFYQLHQTFP